MARDYANRRASRERRKIPRALLAVFAVVCLFGGLAIYAIHYHQAHVQNWLTSAKSLVHQPEKSLEDDIQFDFYTELPNTRVHLTTTAQAKPFSTTVQKSAEQISQPIDLTAKIDESIQSALAQEQNASPKSSPKFIVKINEFDNQLNASQFRLSLLLAGVESEVVKTDEGKFRVQKGPFASEQEAKAAQKQLNKKGFDASIVKTS